MASSFTCRYNRSPEQLRSAARSALAARFPGGFVHEYPLWTFTLKRGMHWPLTSYGETVTLRICAGGEVEITSHYQIPTQIFELGDNHENVEGLARLLDARCAAQPPQCSACSAPLGQSVPQFCTACGQATHTEPREAAPRRSLPARCCSCLLPLLVTVLIVILLWNYPAWIESQMILD